VKADASAREAGRARDKRDRDASPRRDGSAKRSTGRDVGARELDVQRAESRIAELESLLADPALYEGGAESARRAASLSTDLAAARAELDAAMERWLAVADGG
jgi:hypothetical protein